MNGLRRTLLAFYSLVIIAASGGLIGLAWNQDRKLDLSMGDLNLQAFITSGDGAKWLLTGICALVAVFGLLTLIIAVLRPSAARSTGTLRLRQADGGSVEVTAGAIESLLKEELESYPEVRRLDPRVRVNNGAVETYLDAVIEPNASIASVTSVLGQGVAQILRDQVGVTNVRRPNVKISYEEGGQRMVGGPAPRGNGSARPIMREDLNAPLPPPPARPPASAQETVPAAGDDASRAHE